MHYAAMGDVVQTRAIGIGGMRAFSSTALCHARRTTIHAAGRTNAAAACAGATRPTRPRIFAHLCFLKLPSAAAPLVLRSRACAAHRPTAPTAGLLQSVSDDDMHGHGRSSGPLSPHSAPHSAARLHMPSAQAAAPLGPRYTPYFGGSPHRAAPMSSRIAPPAARAADADAVRMPSGGGVRRAAAAAAAAEVHTPLRLSAVCGRCPRELGLVWSSSTGRGGQVPGGPCARTGRTRTQELEL